MTERIPIDELPTKLMHIADCELDGYSEAVARDAADAIVRLTRELAEVKEAWHGRCVIIDERDAEIERLRVTLAVCGAPFDTGPTTIAGAAQIIAAEFERRMNYAANTLNDGTVPAPRTCEQSAREEGK